MNTSGKRAEGNSQYDPCLRQSPTASEASPEQPRSKSARFLPRPLRHPWVMRAVRMLLMGLLLGWGYEWAGPRLYPEQVRFGFFRGMAHGAFMPMALPALLMSKEATIYSEHNTGRSYKLGYITGINLCGLVVFGGAFWKPRRAVQAANAADQNQQARRISVTSKPARDP